MSRLALILTSAVFSMAAHAADFTLTSKDVPADSRLKLEQVYQGYGCTGGNVSPDLSWANPPEGTKSFALEVHDPDAPVANGWWHWLAYNIPAKATSIAHGAGESDSKTLPKGTIQGVTSFGGVGFGGACPPVGHGTHRYNFRLYALKVPKLKLPLDETPVRIVEAIKAQSLGVASFTATYSRE
jgi:Raf kinase inhibitor-like YbhB/YbcL family protein